MEHHHLKIGKSTISMGHLQYRTVKLPEGTFSHSKNPKNLRLVIFGGISLSEFGLNQLL